MFASSYLWCAKDRFPRSNGVSAVKFKVAAITLVKPAHVCKPAKVSLICISSDFSVQQKYGLCKPHSHFLASGSRLPFYEIVQELVHDRKGPKSLSLRSDESSGFLV
ncbi:hypothetical protein CY34DRAFT_809272 [Suillus luteus UH-Slu-Lm8-n1]|uniref:Uncharacterized protein n=1 Tax=Suillus luteus UH-Slu-Lm8-n1 TaxID=930992 RepID=A0A0D0B3V8_9AGAM|nr:hypothetical protein CY34DRAFT_809272 [Suillus luteus UH-Slu-Lm8-n1]